MGDKGGGGEREGEGKERREGRGVKGEDSEMIAFNAGMMILHFAY